MLVRDGFEAKWNEAMHEVEWSIAMSRTPDISHELPKQDERHVISLAVVRSSERKVPPKDDLQQNRAAQQRKDIERLQNELKLSQLRAQVEKTKCDERDIARAAIGRQSRPANGERRTALQSPTSKPIRRKKPIAFTQIAHEEAGLKQLKPEAKPTYLSKNRERASVPDLEMEELLEANIALSSLETRNATKSPTQKHEHRKPKIWLSDERKQPAFRQSDPKNELRETEQQEIGTKPQRLNGETATISSERAPRSKARHA